MGSSSMFVIVGAQLWRHQGEMRYVDSIDSISEESCWTSKEAAYPSESTSAVLKTIMDLEMMLVQSDVFVGQL